MDFAFGRLSRTAVVITRWLDHVLTSTIGVCPDTVIVSSSPPRVDLR